MDQKQACRSSTRHACVGRPMKVKGPGRDFGPDFGVGSVAGGSRRGLDRLLWPWFGPGGPVDRRELGGFRPRGVGAGGCRRFDGGDEGLGCGWARVEDVSKRRRQGLVVCRATLPFEGLVMRAPVSRSRPPRSPPRAGGPAQWRRAASRAGAHSAWAPALRAEMPSSRTVPGDLRTACRRGSRALAHGRTSMVWDMITGCSEQKIRY